MQRYLTILKRAIKGFGSHNGTSFAAAIAYNAIFSIFPLILLAIAVLGFFLHNPQQRESAVDALFSVLGSNVSKDALRSEVDAVAGGSVALSLFGILAALWSATGVFDQIRTSLQVIWDSTKDRPLVQQKLIDAGMLFTVGVLILLSLAATATLTAFERFETQLLGNSLSAGVHLLFALATILIPTAISFCAFSLMYWIVPHATIRLRNVWFGALVAAVALEVVQLLFASYVANFGHYSKTYGTLGGIIAFLFFVYVAGCIILFGGEVAKEHIDVLTGVKPVQEQEAEAPKPKQSLAEQAGALAKGLVIDSSPHHDTSLPYEPGRTEPVNPSAALVKDKQKEPERTPARQSRASRQTTGSRGLTSKSGDGRTPTPADGRWAAAEAQRTGVDGTGSGQQWETTLLASTVLLASFGAYELLHQVLGLNLPFVEHWKAQPTKR